MLLALRQANRSCTVMMLQQPVADTLPVPRRKRRLELAPSDVLKTHARTSFSLATRFLPPEKRRSTTILYAFFRSLDDVVDAYAEGSDVSHTLDYLGHWREWARAPNGAGARPGLAVAVDRIFETYEIPRTLLEEFISGLESDVNLRQIDTQADFRRYCYCVASTVGITMAHVLGARESTALRAAEQLGVAMQMTNVLRDIGEDLEIGRVYVPRTVLERFGLSRDVLMALRGNRAEAGTTLEPIMKWLIAENRRLYREALPGIFLLPEDSRLPILLASRLYRHLLSVIESNGYDSINIRASTSRWDKMRELAICKTMIALWQIDENGLPGGR